MIRKAILSDASAVRSCAESAYGRYVALIGRRPAPMDADHSTQIAAGQVHVSVNQAGALEGYIVFFARGDHMFLDAVGVRPSAAGRGVGKALIRRCEDEARRLQLRSVHLYTNAKMVDNLSIYPHLGYVEIDRRVDEGFDRVFFAKVLA